MFRRIHPSAVYLTAAAVLLGIWTGLMLPDMTPGRAVTARTQIRDAELQPAAAAVTAGERAYHFGFKKSRGGQPASIDQEGFKPLLEKYGAVFQGKPDDKSLYLTFDNGYENGYTAQILDVLKVKGVPACFFVTGHYAKNEHELLKRMAAEGHIIGNHSWTHPDMSQISDTRIQDELDAVKREVAGVTGQQEMHYLRPPRGIFSERSLRVSKELGYTNVFWSVAYKDWDVNAQRGAQYAFDNVTEQLHPGAIILLHSVSRDNAEALGSIIDEARRRGYTFRSLDELTQRVPTLP